jgi:hypothetical protein
VIQGIHTFAYRYTALLYHPKVQVCIIGSIRVNGELFNRMYDKYTSTFVNGIFLSFVSD